MSDVKEAKNTNEEINFTMNYKEITEGNDREYSDSVTEVYGDENSESEYKLEVTTQLTEDNSSDVMDSIGMIIHIQEETLESVTSSTEKDNPHEQ